MNPEDLLDTELTTVFMGHRMTGKIVKIELTVAGEQFGFPAKATVVLQSSKINEGKP